MQQVKTFPHVVLSTGRDRLPVEVTLITQLGVGAGTKLITQANQRQSEHDAFVDELDEPSTKIGDIHFKQGDQSSLYTFSVAEGGHPFHRHDGNRTFTAVSGSGGTLLRFSIVNDADMKADEDSFIDGLRHITIPPDCLFTVRFGGGTWHQFVPLTQSKKGGTHPTLFAISCHTDECSGITDETLKQQIKNNEATIPMLTEVLSDSLQTKLANLPPERIQTTHLSLKVSPHSFMSRLCAWTRYYAGRVQRVIWQRFTWLNPLIQKEKGFVS